MQKSFIRSIALIAVALGLFSQPAAFAQVITTSSLNGTVVNDQGQPVAGAAITVQHEETGSTYNATSRADGSFVLRGLRPGGPYTIRTSAEGLANAENREVFLDLERGADVTVRMRSDVVQLEAFSVTASAADQLFDTNQMGASSYYNERDIRNLPTGDRSINSLARLDPKISYNRDPQDRAISVAGLSNRYNSIQVDGVSASDPFGLNANNTAAERNVIPLDSLEALTVTTSADVRRTGFVGAQINAITKSGTNEFHGSLYYTYRDQNYVGDEIDGQTFALPDFKEKTWGATLRGPIIPRKLFFSLSYEEVNEDRIPPSPTAPVDPAILTQIANAATALGFTPGSASAPAGNKLTDENILAKVDWEINANHRATVRYNDVESSRPTFPGMGGSGVSQNNFSFDSHWYDQKIKNTSYIGQLISRWGDRLNTEVSVSRSQYDSMPMNNTRQPRVQVRNVPVAGSSNTSFVNLGTEISRHANILKVDTDTAELFASYELNDNHTLQAGVQYDIADIYNLFVQNSLGSYDFNNLTEFLNVAANNNGTVNYREYIYNQIIPGVEPAALFKESNLGFFVKDTWRVNPNLTIDAGARIDIAGLPDSIPFNQAFQTAFGVRNDHSYDGEKIIQPRAGFNWSPELDGKRTIFRGSAGLYYGRAPRVWISNSYSNTGMNFRTYRAGSSSGTGLIAPAVSSNADNQPTTASGAPAMQVAFMSPDFQLPSKWKANLAVERELGLWDLKFTAEIEQMWTDKDVFYSNINLTSTRSTTDGRLLYFNTYAAATQASNGNWNGSSGTRLVNTGFTNRIIQVGNTDKGEARTITLAIDRPRKKDGWSWRAAYVNTHTTETLFGTSSVAASNWQNRAVFNVNAEEEHRGELEVRHRFTFNLTKDFELFSGFRTIASLFYEGRSGYPFSFVFTNDANGDSVTQNDLVYVPRRGGDPLVRFATPADETRFFAIVDRFGLPEGEALSAASNRYPWVNTFDLSIKQEVKLPGWRHRMIFGVDVLNIGNLINDEWGIIRGSNQFFIKREGVATATYDGVANQYVYSSVSSALAGSEFSPSLGRGEPAATRWSVLFSARYEF